MPVAAYNNPYRTTRPVENSYSRLSSPFGWKSPMSQSFMSGRSFMDPNRAGERAGRIEERRFRQGPMGGGGSRGGPRGPMAPMPQVTQRWNDEELNDQALINFGNMPSMGQEYAGALTRVQNGGQNLGDMGILQQRLNPSATPESNNARARQQWRMFARSGSFGGRLVGAGQQALFG